MSKVTFVDFPHDSNWVKGTHADGYVFTAKLFDVGSRFGIHEGRVSKLDIRDSEGNWILNYDREWDLRPATAEHQTVFEEVLEFLEHAPTRFS